MKSSWIFVWGLAFIAFMTPTAARGDFIPIDSAATYLHTNQDPANDAKAYSLASLGLTQGEAITLTEVGTYSRGPGYANIYTDLNAVFSSTSVLLGSDNEDRVPDAIGVGVYSIVTPPTFIGNQVTDIADDFYIEPFGSTSITGVTVVIPAGAAYLFFSTDDVYFNDNTSPNNTFGVDIEPATVPEPASLTLGLLGMMGSVAFASARKVRRGNSPTGRGRPTSR